MNKYLKKLLLPFFVIALFLILNEMPMQIAVSHDVYLVLGGENFQPLIFLSFFVLYIIVVIMHLALILLFLEYIAKIKRIEYLFKTKNIFLLSMYVTLSNSFLVGYPSLESFLTTNPGIHFNIGSFFIYSLITFFIIKVMGKAITPIQS